MGWASGFQAGSTMAKQWLDTYRDAERRSQFEGIQKAKEFEQYTPQQGEQMRGLSEQVDSEGRQKYQFEIDPGSTQYRVREIIYPQARPDIEGYSPSWLGRDTGLAPQQSAEVSTSPVPMDGLDVRTVLDSNAPGYERDRTPIRSGLGFYPAMGAEAADTAPRAYTDLTASGPEYSPDLRISRPDDSAAYRGLTREMGEAQNFAPGQVNYLGKSYAPGGLTPEVRRAAQLEAYADVIARDNPLEAERLRSMAAQEKRAQAGEGRAQAQEDRAQKEFKVSQAIREMDLEDRETVNKALPVVQDMLAKNPNMPMSEVVNQMTQLGVKPDAVLKVATAYSGLREASVKDTDRRVEQAFKENPTLDSLVNFSKSDKDFDPLHNWQVRNVDGKIVIDTVLTADPSKVISSTPAFSDEREAMGYLYNQSKNPGQLVEWTQNIELNRAKIENQRAEAKYRTSVAGAYDRGEKASRSGTPTGLQERRALNAELSTLSNRQEMLQKELREARSPEERESINNQLKTVRRSIAGIEREMTPYYGASGGAGGPVIKAGEPFEGPDGKLYTIDKDMPKSQVTPQIAKPYVEPKSESKSGLKKEEPPKASKSLNQPKPSESSSAALDKYGRGGESARQKPVSVANDTVLVTINRELAKLGPATPNNVAQVNALQRAKEARVRELQQRYGSMTELITE